MQDSQIIRTEYSNVMKKSYIDYAMSVIIARALPDVRDGLKPVQRRTCLLYTSFLLSDPLCQGVYQKAGGTDCGDHLSYGLHPVRRLGASCGSPYPAF